MAIIEAVLWDMDGILVDSERLYQRVFVELMTETGLLENPKERYLDTIGLNRQSIIAWYVNQGADEETAEYYCTEVGNRYMQLIKTELTLKTGVVEALTTIQELGLPQMVVTSSKTEHAHTKLAKLNIADFFSNVIGGDQVSQGKPNPEPYLSACEFLDVHPSNALVIEDSPNGVRAGIEAGCMVVHVPDLIDTDPEWVDEIYAALDSLTSFESWFTAQRGGDWL